VLKRHDKKRALDQIARDYFNYLGIHLPQQCASDEFYFLPRAEAAIQHLDVLDDLCPGKIQDHLGYVKNLLKEIPAGPWNDPEKEIDCLLLKQSMESFVREFEDAKVWQADPTLYIKIPLFATEQVLSGKNSTSGRIKDDLSRLFAQIPPFLATGIKNLRFPSEISLQVAGDMAQDALEFYSKDMRRFILERTGEDKGLVAENKKILEAWEKFKTDLVDMPSGNFFAVGKEGLEKILGISLGYPKSIKEILEIVQSGYGAIQEKLRALAGEIGGHKDWKDIIYERIPSVSSPAEVMQLYKKEIENLRSFFSSRDIVSFPSGEKVAILQTPTYLRSLRATASYRAPLTGSINEHGIFYITPGKEDLRLISAHCPYLSAHESYPGHHILDHLRIQHSNSIRRQIESPLFYEGWACYSEMLLDETGYIDDPRKKLIGLKRQLWRNIRATLDIELQTGEITLAQGAKKIENVGYSLKRAQRQIRRFCLTPGYQLCYYIGMYEILKLRERFSGKLPLRTFHDILLSGGQLPFHLAERRLENSIKGRKKG
jgi:hypothetical protein